MFVDDQLLDVEDGNDINREPESPLRSNDQNNTKSKRGTLNGNEPSGETASGTGHDINEKKRVGRPKKKARPLRRAKGSTSESDFPTESPLVDSTPPLGSKISTQGEAYEEIQLPDTETNVPAKRGRKRKIESLVTDVQNPSIHTAGSHGGVFGIDKSAREKNSEKTISEISKVDRPRRSRIAPLQFWKNERRIYKVDERRESGTAVSLSEQVIRVEDTPVTKPKKKHRSQPTSTKTSGLAKRKTREKSDADSSDSETDDEDWESTGKLVGMVKQWPSKPTYGEVGEIEDGGHFLPIDVVLKRHSLTKTSRNRDFTAWHRVQTNIWI
ncbi:hypothetical protein AA313_de0205981 [Arthrobotrys entomopaga]|nr:hypothetical protein AA313_de0205981 [Arthrobotrys entomopaga]